MNQAEQKERMDDMLARYGEVCSKAEAGRILRRSINTINAMLEDGRIDYACGGGRVDVRSIARYICMPRQEDFRARQKRAKERTGCKYRV